MLARMAKTPGPSREAVVNCSSELPCNAGFVFARWEGGGKKPWL